MNTVRRVSAGRRAWLRLVDAFAAVVLPLSIVGGGLVHAQQDPLVLVVHGVGPGGLFDSGGNRPDGWSDGIANAWKVPVQEINFRHPGGTYRQSYTDFGSYAREWALSVQSQIQAAVRANPGRRVIIVSHSWGTVVTKLALMGGQASGEVAPISGVTVDEWVTLGSPLGSDGSLRSLAHVEVQDGRPTPVKHWTNFYDPEDIISTRSQNLAGAENVEVTGSASSYPWNSAHMGIWTNPRVMAWLRARFDELATLPGETPSSTECSEAERRPIRFSA